MVVVVIVFRGKPRMRLSFCTLELKETGYVHLKAGSWNSSIPCDTVSNELSDLEQIFPGARFLHHTDEPCQVKSVMDIEKH